MPRAGRRSPSPRSPRASTARRPSGDKAPRHHARHPSGETATMAVTPRQTLWLELMPFYIHEAWLLDERRFKEWLDLFTDDVLYFMPRRKNVLRREAHREVTPLGDLALIEDDRRYLEMRVARLDTGMAWGEDPLHARVIWSATWPWNRYRAASSKRRRPSSYTARTWRRITSC